MPDRSGMTVLVMLQGMEHYLQKQPKMPVIIQNMEHYQHIIDYECRPRSKMWTLNDKNGAKCS